LAPTQLICETYYSGKYKGANLCGAYGAEKTLISAVFHNRLKRGMKLQSDPTAIYNLQQEVGHVKTVLLRHLKSDTPHNTYRIDGLVPGKYKPIHARDVAGAVVRLAKEDQPGRRIVESAQLRAWAQEPPGANRLPVC